MSVSKRRVIAGMGVVLLLLLGVGELWSQPQSDWVDTWPTGTKGIKPILDTVENPEANPCTDVVDSIVTLGYEPDTTLGIDSCNWSAWPSGPGCSCGGLYPGGPAYHRSTWGVNYDPAYFGFVSDTCDHDNPTWAGGGAPQPRHLYNVPCGYETDTNDPNHPYITTGCFTMQIGVTHCMAGKQLRELQFDFSNYDLSCFGDSVTITDISDPSSPGIPIVFEKDSLGVPKGSTKFLYDLGQNNTIPPAPPCSPRILTFEVCGLWKNGRSPAEHECAAVFEVKFLNSDASECGIIPFIVGGRCPDLDIEPVEDEGGASLSYRMYYDGR